MKLEIGDMLISNGFTKSSKIRVKGRLNEIEYIRSLDEYFYYTETHVMGEDGSRKTLRSAIRKDSEKSMWEYWNRDEWVRWKRNRSLNNILKD